MINSIVSSGDLNQIRQELYGAASLTFYTVSPSAGETAVATIYNDWLSWRKQRMRDDGVSGAISIYLASSAAIDISEIRQNAVVDLNINSQIMRYVVVEITSVQQLGAGWILHCTPLNGTV